MYRSFLFVSCALVCLSACAQKDVVAPRDVTLTATLLDSLAARPVDSQKVYFTVGGRLDSVITNLSGGFAVTMPPGPVQITYADYGRYEDFDRTVTVGRDTAVVLRLRRTLPYLTDFAISA